MFSMKYVLSLSFVTIDVISEMLQAGTITQAEEKGDSTSLLAKLHHGVTEFLDEAAVIQYAAIGERKYIFSGFVLCKHCLAVLLSRLSYAVIQKALCFHHSKGP